MRIIKSIYLYGGQVHGAVRAPYQHVYREDLCLPLVLDGYGGRGDRIKPGNMGCKMHALKVIICKYIILKEETPPINLKKYGKMQYFS